MEKKSHMLLLIGMTIYLTFFNIPKLQAQEDTGGIVINPGINLEYFLRTIKWNENKNTSKLESYFASFEAVFEIEKGFTMNVLVGFSLSHYKDLIFRKLPLSMKLEGKGISGFLLGTEVQKRVMSFGNIEVSGIGQFDSYLAIKKKWEVPGLSVKGQVEGQPIWMRVSIGPCFTYTGIDYFYPYVSINFNKLWGTFKMDQNIQDLKSSEDIKISGESILGISVGSNYEATDDFTIKGELSLLPYNKGIDYGFSTKVIYSF